MSHVHFNVVALAPLTGTKSFLHLLKRVLATLEHYTLLISFIQFQESLLGRIVPHTFFSGELGLWQHSLSHPGTLQAFHCLVLADILQKGTTLFFRKGLSLSFSIYFEVFYSFCSYFHYLIVPTSLRGMLSAFNYSEQFFVWLQVSPPSCGISLVQTIFLSLGARPLWWNGYHIWLAHLGSALLSKVMAGPLLWKVKWLPSSVGFLRPAFPGNLFQPQEQERYQGPGHLVTLACTDSHLPHWKEKTSLGPGVF